jgi:hypothetical protein
MTRFRSRWPLLALAVAVGGCALQQMKAENERREGDVRAKKTELSRLEDANRAVQAERTRLMDDLRTRQLTASEMEQRLQALKRLNADSRADTPEQQRQQATRERQIDEAVNQVRSTREDPAASQEAKARRLEEVRRQLRKTLELMAST